MTETFEERVQSGEVTFVKPSESPTLAKQKADRYAARKAAIVRDVQRGTRPPEDLDKFNDELRREEERTLRREEREEAIDVAAERKLREEREAAIDREADLAIEAARTR
jgi:hypothetical protein